MRVLVAAASVVVRAGLEALVTASPSLSVVGRTNLASLTEQVEALQPHVLLIELGCNDESTAEKLFTLSAEALEPAVVVLADDLNSSWIGEALRSGVRAILPQQASGEEIIAALGAVGAGLVVLHPDLLDVMIPTASLSRPLPTAPNQALTPREIEVLGMLAEGLGNKAIARHLNISEHTVKFHVGSLFVKLNASSRTEAVTLGARQGLIML